MFYLISFDDWHATVYAVSSVPVAVREHEMCVPCADVLTAIADRDNANPYISMSGERYALEIRWEVKPVTLESKPFDRFKSAQNSLGYAFNALVKLEASRKAKRTSSGYAEELASSVYALCFRLRQLGLL